MGVGGTTLNVDVRGNYIGETAWSGSGGGLSTVEVEPLYQSHVNASGKRGIPDVAYNADPNTGFAVYTSVLYRGFGGWVQVGGTSAASPQWAALIAIANSIRASAHKSPLTGIGDVLYGAKPADYHDVTAGSNGACGAVCTATAGYDLVTGLGSPQVPQLLNALAK